MYLKAPARTPSSPVACARAHTRPGQYPPHLMPAAHRDARRGTHPGGQGARAGAGADATRTQTDTPGEPAHCLTSPITCLGAPATPPPLPARVAPSLRGRSYGFCAGVRWRPPLCRTGPDIAGSWPPGAATQGLAPVPPALVKFQSSSPRLSPPAPNKLKRKRNISQLQKFLNTKQGVEPGSSRVSA